MANPFLARLLDTQQRGLQAERERQMRNDAFGNLGFLGQSLQKSFQPLAEMQQREDLQTQAEQARANLQKQSQENEKQNIMLRNRLEAEALYKPITEEFSVQDEDGVTRTGTRPILFDAQGRRTEDVSIGKPMTRSELENIRTGQKVSAENVARLGAVFKGDVVIDGKSYSFADANRMKTVKDLEAKIKTDASAQNQIIDNPYFVNEKDSPGESPKISVRMFLDRVKKADTQIQTEAEKELITTRFEKEKERDTLAQTNAKELIKERSAASINENKERLKNEEAAQIRKLGGVLTADGMVRVPRMMPDGTFLTDRDDLPVYDTMPLANALARAEADRTSAVTTAQMEAAEPFKKDELKRQTEQRKTILKEEFGYNKQLKEFSFKNEKELQKIQFDYGNTKDALNRISQTTNIGEAQEALSQIEGISEGLQKSILAQVRKNNSDQTTSDNEKIFRNNLLVAQLIPDSKDKLDFLQGKGIIPEGTYVDPNSKIFVQEVLAKTVEKFDGEDTSEIVSTAKSLGLDDDQAEAFGRLAKINAGSVNRDFQQKLLYSGILSESQQFELAKKLDPSGMKGITNFEPWKESRIVVQQLIEGGNIPSDAALEQAGFAAENFKSIKELASKKGLNTKAKEILNGISNFLENDDVTDEQRTEYYNSINTPANKEALKSLGLSELIQFQGLSEKKLNDKQKDVDASNLQLSKQELNEAQAFYYNNYKGNSSQVQSAVTKLWLDASKDIYALHSGDNITAIEKITELTESLSEQYPGWNPPGGAGTVPSVSSQLTTGGNFNTGGNNNNQGGATENLQVNPPVINRGDFDSVENRSLNQRLDALPNYDNLSSTERRKKLIDEPLKDKITRAEGALRDVNVKAEDVATSAFELGKDFNDWLEKGKGSLVDWVNSKVEQIKN
tara:strand:+ start:1453 stop:4170 length:2718 start_codon:yes stop_codon:yes gene_type:complete